jgi:hypothetical protein
MVKTEKQSGMEMAPLRLASASRVWWMQNAEESEKLPGFYPRARLKSVFLSTTVTLNLDGVYSPFSI